MSPFRSDGRWRTLRLADMPVWTRCAFQERPSVARAVRFKWQVHCDRCKPWNRHSQRPVPLVRHPVTHVCRILVLSHLPPRGKAPSSENRLEFWACCCPLVVEKNLIRFPLQISTCRGDGVDTVSRLSGASNGWEIAVVSPCFSVEAARYK